jgi:hypothetical protein
MIFQNNINIILSIVNNCIGFFTVNGPNNDINKKKWTDINKKKKQQ